MTAGRRRTLVSFSMDATGMVFDITFGPKQVHVGVFVFARMCVCVCVCVYSHKYTEVHYPEHFPL